MNTRQRQILKAVAIVVGLMLLWPPMMYGQGGARGEGFRWIFGIDSYRIDGMALMALMFGAVIIGTIAYLLAKDPP